MWYFWATDAARLALDAKKLHPRHPDKTISQSSLPPESHPVMTVSRAALSTILACALVGCGGGGSSAPPISGGASPTPTPTPTPTTSACSLRAQQDFADRVLNEWYLFPDLLANANPASFNALQDYLDARVAPARAQDRDRFFTFATSIAEENALISSGAI